MEKLIQLLKKLRKPNLASVFLLLALLVQNSFAYDTAKADYLKDVWDRIVDFINGTGGLIIAIFVVGFGIYLIVARGGLVWGLGMFALAAVIYYLPNIVQGMGAVF